MIKKLFFFIFTIFMSVNMMATEVTILPSDFEPVTNSDYIITKDSVTVLVTASTVTADQMRIFKNQSITISSDLVITRIEFTCTAKGAAKYGPGCFNEQNGYTFEEDGYVGTWEGETDSITFVSTLNQVRATQIVITINAPDSVPEIIIPDTVPETPTALTEIEYEMKERKVFSNGQIFIIKNGQIFNILGRKID